MEVTFKSLFAGASSAISPKQLLSKHLLLNSTPQPIWHRERMSPYLTTGSECTPDNKQKTWEKTGTGSECTPDKQRDPTWDRRTPATTLSFTLAFSHNVEISECTHDSTNITLFDVNQHHTLVTTRPIDGAGANTQDSTRWMQKPNERAGTRARPVLHTQRSYKV